VNLDVITPANNSTTRTTEWTSSLWFAWNATSKEVELGWKETEMKTFVNVQWQQSHQPVNSAPSPIEDIPLVEIPRFEWFAQQTDDTLIRVKGAGDVEHSFFIPQLMQGGPLAFSTMTVTMPNSPEIGHPMRLPDLTWLINPVLRDGEIVVIESVECALVGTEVMLSNGGCFLNPQQDGTSEKRNPLLEASAHQLDDEERQQSALSVLDRPASTDTALTSVAKAAVEAGHVHIAETLVLFGEDFDALERELRSMLGNIDGRQASMLGAASQVKDFGDKEAADMLRDRLRTMQGVVGGADKHKLVAEANKWFVELMRDKHYHGVAIITRELNISSIDLSAVILLMWSFCRL
jgi:hypothetical protein